MPRGDRTGPAGMGSMTGRGLGYCAGNVAPGFASGSYGRGGGFGRGFGLGSRRGGYGYQAAYPAYPPPYAPWTYGNNYPPVPGQTTGPDLAALQSQAEQLQTMLTNVQKQMEEMEAHKED